MRKYPRVTARRRATASEVVLLPRATHRYQSIRAPLTALRLRMRELVQTRIRYGYRKIRVLLIRQGNAAAKSKGTIFEIVYRGAVATRAWGTILIARRTRGALSVWRTELITSGPAIQIGFLSVR